MPDNLIDMKYLMLRKAINHELYSMELMKSLCHKLENKNLQQLKKIDKDLERLIIQKYKLLEI